LRPLPRQLVVLPVAVGAQTPYYGVLAP
jgi:hypothetical protein